VMHYRNHFLNECPTREHICALCILDSDKKLIFNDRHTFEMHIALVHE